MSVPDKSNDQMEHLLPVEVEVYVNPDGSVTFADLEADMVSVARKLDPGWMVPPVPSTAQSAIGRKGGVMGKIEHLWATIVQIVRDQVSIIVMRCEVSRLKIKNYDRLVRTVEGLRRALDTQKRALDDLYLQLSDRDEQIKKLQGEYASLQQQRLQSEADSLAAERLDVFKRVQAIAVQLPTLRTAIDDGADVAARDVLDLLAPFNEMLRDFGFEMIGEAGAQVPYDPNRHRPVGRGARAVKADDRVRVRYVGYLYKGQVVCKAEVVCVEQPEMVAEG
ncbi:MAG: hypothetical protein JXB07_17065 [Anaerolineae bacterium]|nr:hypothetical protein [Anaerolineae bacterium]